MPETPEQIAKRMAEEWLSCVGKRCTSRGHEARCPGRFHPAVSAAMLPMVEALMATLNRLGDDWVARNEIEKALAPAEEKGDNPAVRRLRRTLDKAEAEQRAAKEREDD